VVDVFVKLVLRAEPSSHDLESNEARAYRILRRRDQERDDRPDGAAIRAATG
jgi:hypothetical protein